MTPRMRLELPAPEGLTLKSARLSAGLSQVEAAELMGYPVQPGSRGGLQSRTWQALESATDTRNMPAPVFALFLLLPLLVVFAEALRQGVDPVFLPLRLRIVDALPRNDTGKLPREALLRLLG